MSKTLNETWQPTNPGGLAGQFVRLGWIGFWIQVILLAAPVLLLIYVLFLSSPESIQSKGLDLSNYLSYGSLLVMAFTTLWFFLYTRVGKRIADPDMRPPQSSVMRTLWVGMWAGCIGIFFSLLLMLASVGRLLFVLLATPQSGLQIAPAGGDPTTTLSAIDAVSLTSLVLILTAELIVLGFTLWLIFQVTRRAADNPEAAA